MKRFMKTFITIKAFILFAIMSFCVQQKASAQLCEWRLTNETYNITDPDAAGPATGSVTFTLQVRTTSGTIPDVTAISVGFSYQSSLAMIPTTPGCAIVSTPANVAVSSAFAAGGYTYSVVNQCGSFSQTSDGQTFDKRAVGTGELKDGDRLM